MAHRWTRLGWAKAWAFALLALTFATPCWVRAQYITALSALNKQVVQLYQAGKYDEAVVIARQSLTLAERLHEPDHPSVGTSVYNLALLYDSQGRYAEAEPLCTSALSASARRRWGRSTRMSARNKQPGRAVFLQGRYAEAEPLYKRALAINEKALGTDHPSVGTA